MNNIKENFPILNKKIDGKKVIYLDSALLHKNLTVSLTI